jgi:hypothetical protein
VVSTGGGKFHTLNDVGRIICAVKPWRFSAG